MLRYIFVSLCFVLMPSALYAAGSAYPSPNNSTASPIACVDAASSNEMQAVGCDASGNLIVTIVPSSTSNHVNGKVDIPDAGATDRTQLPDVTVNGECDLQALPGNTGPIYVGGSTVTNSSGTNEGIRLNQNDTLTRSPSNLDEIYVATDNAGDDIKWLCN